MTAVSPLGRDIIALLNTPKSQASLAMITRGIERESARSHTNQLANTAHPAALGAPLTHPYITTDFAEAQLELVTPALTSRADTFAALASLHQFVDANLAEGEWMWPTSMPPYLPNDDAIEIARYGASNQAKLKERYRQGLAHRYGKRMQLISGIHYNFSLPDQFWRDLHHVQGHGQPLESFISERYFALIRNVMRHGWILAYLFGASPVVDRSYIATEDHALLAFDETSLYLPYATSLRLSSIGYSSAEQARYPLSYDSKAQYLDGLCQVLRQPSHRYQALPAEGQLNSAVIQLENELYGAIRPKIVDANLRPLNALCHKGLQYVELRSLDTNPFLPFGIDEHQSAFLDLFLLYCALAPSDALSLAERQSVAERQNQVALYGRDPNLRLPSGEGAMSVKALGLALLEPLEALATLFDRALGTSIHQSALAAQRAKLHDSGLTPSAQMLHEMQTRSQSFAVWAGEKAAAHRAQFRNQSVDEVWRARLTQAVTQSHRAQAALEAQPQMPFDVYLAQKNQLDCDCTSLALTARERSDLPLALGA
ncbi:glutamate--cysteine ligase [Vibrio sp. SM6]|uniref:Glutamate--cysteine ligase n=1 Tax=Vibrio agarilyticus TaxID=2726741 RepID=A0A7X8TN91_9VIBR|nr:glutamate--cysteine ligase [Vibrio agarilyticus]NLS11871.1 glutamate--cysteine ligase [Vibrio agarilyticus]